VKWIAEVECNESTHELARRYGQTAPKCVAGLLRGVAMQGIRHTGRTTEQTNHSMGSRPAMEGDLPSSERNEFRALLCPRSCSRAATS
jgi:hypothetical protein